jgi:hypothetical protein
MAEELPTHFVRTASHGMENRCVKWRTADFNSAKAASVYFVTNVVVDR